jgi:hypothetical protein
MRHGRHGNLKYEMHAWPKNGEIQDGWLAIRCACSLAGIFLRLHRVATEYRKAQVKFFKN